MYFNCCDEPKHLLPHKHTAGTLSPLARSPEDLEATVPAPALFTHLLRSMPSAASLGLAFRLVNILAPASRDPAKDDEEAHASSRTASASRAGPRFEPFDSSTRKGGASSSSSSTRSLTGTFNTVVPTYANRSDRINELAFKGMATMKKGGEPLYWTLSKSNRFPKWRQRWIDQQPELSSWQQYRTCVLTDLFEAVRATKDVNRMLLVFTASLRLEMGELTRITGRQCALVLETMSENGALSDTEQMHVIMESLGFTSPELSIAHLHCLAARVIPPTTSNTKQSSLEEAAAGKAWRGTARFVPAKIAITGSQRVFEAFDRAFPEASTSGAPDAAFGALFKACTNARDAAAGQRLLTRLEQRNVPKSMYLYRKQLSFYEYVALYHMGFLMQRKASSPVVFKLFCYAHLQLPHSQVHWRLRVRSTPDGRDRSARTVQRRPHYLGCPDELLR